MRLKKWAKKLMKPSNITPEILVPTKEGEPDFLAVVARFQRLNQIARIGCEPEPLVDLAARLYVEYKDRGELTVLAW